MRRLLAFVLLTSAAALPARAAPAIEDLRVTPLKDGSRLAVTWTTDEPTTGLVEYGSGPASMPGGGIVGLHHVDEPGTRHLVTFDVARYATYWVRVTATGTSGTAVSAPVTVRALNGPSGWDEAAGAYRFNVLIRFDWDLDASEMAAWSAHATEFATRVADMTDGTSLLGDVILVDAAGRDVIWAEDCTIGYCPTDADVAVFTGTGFSFYFGNARALVMWQQSRLGGIANALSAIEFPRYLFWDGLVPVDMTEEWWTGRRLAHEFGHYAFWLQDQYDGVTCENPAFDVSIMNNDLAFSELDSAGAPCAWQQANRTTSWDIYRGRYKEVPQRAGAPDPGPLSPGPLFRLIALDRGVA